MHHYLKILQQYFQPVIDGIKTFEIRRDHREYQAGDTVTLLECEDGLFTGRSATFTIGYVSDYNQQPGYVVFSLIPNADVTGAAPNGKETKL